MAALCLILVVIVVRAGCTIPKRAGSLTLVDSPAVPISVQEIPNPLRGQYESLMTPLFPQDNPAQKRYPPWPASYDSSLRISWRELQPVDPATLPPDAPDEAKFDFSVIDDALNKLGSRNMRTTLRIFSYSSCCKNSYPDNTNISIPDWMRPAAHVYSDKQKVDAGRPLEQVVPEWNDPRYLDAFSRLLEALGRRYDGDERVSVFEFSGYGDWSENHISYLRDSLGAPGPSPGESVAKLGYYSQYRDQSITADSIRKLVAANVGAFPRTQLITTVVNPEIVRQLFAEDVTKKLSAPVGIRSDCIGVMGVLHDWAERGDSHYVQAKDPIITELKRRLAATPVLTEWCTLPQGADRHRYYEKALHDVIKYHVALMSAHNFEAASSTSPMDPVLFLLWAQSNVVAGYRYSVQADPGSESVRERVAKLDVKWTNYGSAAAMEKWVPKYRLVDFFGQTVRGISVSVLLKTLVSQEFRESARDAPEPVSATETVSIDMAGLAPGRYTLVALVDWEQHKTDASHVVNYAPMRLARDGRDESGAYPLATLDISRDTLKTSVSE